MNNSYWTYKSQMVLGQEGGRLQSRRGTSQIAKSQKLNTDSIYKLRRRVLLSRPLTFRLSSEKRSNVHFGAARTASAVFWSVQGKTLKANGHVKSNWPSCGFNHCRLEFASGELLRSRNCCGPQTASYRYVIGPIVHGRLAGGTTPFIRKYSTICP